MQISNRNQQQPTTPTTRIIKKKRERKRGENEKKSKHKLVIYFEICARALFFSISEGSKAGRQHTHYITNSNIYKYTRLAYIYYCNFAKHCGIVRRGLKYTPHPLPLIYLYIFLIYRLLTIVSQVYMLN